MARPDPASPSPADSPPEPLYPVIESFAEFASRDDVASLFAGLKESLAALKGPKAEQAKKAKLALERTEELLLHLLETREKLEAEKKGPRGRR